MTETYLNNYINMNRSMIESLLVCMEQETYMMKTIREAGIADLSIVEEGWKESIKEFFAIIIKFFNETFNMFKSKAKALQQRYSEWSILNRIKLKTLDYSKLSRRMIPYWKGDPVFAKLTDGLNKVNLDIINNINVSRTNTEETKKNDYLPLIANTMNMQGVVKTESGNIIEITKNYFRTGTPELSEPITISGEDLKTAVMTALKYCDNYLSGMVRKFIVEQNKIIAAINKIENILNTKSINTEQMLYMISDVQYDILFEETKEKPLASDNEKPKVNPTNVETVDTEKPKTEIVKKTGEVNPDEKISKTDTAALTKIKEAFKAQKLILSCAITIAEEKNTAYNNLLKSVSNVKSKEAEEKK